MKAPARSASFRTTLMVSSALALAGCQAGASFNSDGGGGDPTPFETAEFLTNFGLGSINASSAYAQGFDGSGATIAIIDSGVDLDHPDLNDNISGQSIGVNLGTFADANDVNGHGTAVAGIAAAERNGVGMHGVAPSADILAIGATSVDDCTFGCTFSDGDLAAATNYARTRSDVINLSLGSAVGIGPGFANALQNAVGDDVVIVAAAGNDGFSNPSFPAQLADDPGANGQVIAVGSVDRNNNLSSFSNRAGVIQDFYLVAPGEDIVTTGIGGGLTTANGTSFSAPHVSGAVALIRGRFPFLTAREVVDILLTSAIDLGDPGTDPIFGRGLLNLGGALGPLGTLSIPNGLTVNAGGDALTTTSLRLGAAFGDAMGSSRILSQAIILDDYNRPYVVDLTGAIHTHPARPSLLSLVEDAWETTDVTVPTNTGGLLHLSFRTERDTGSIRHDDPTRNSEEVRFSLRETPFPGTDLVVSQGYDGNAYFGIAGTGTLDGAFLLGQDSLVSPYLNLAGDGQALIYGTDMGDGFAIRIGVLTSEAMLTEDTGEETSSRVGYITEVSRRFDSGLQLGLQVGGLREDGSILDTSGEAAFDPDGSADTMFAGAYGTLPVTERTTLFGLYSTGWTDASDIGSSLVGGFSGIRSDAASIGATTRDVWLGDDRLTLAVSRPLRVNNGEATVEVPVGRTLDGRILRLSESVGLSPSGQQVDADINYGIDIAPGESLRLNVLTQFQPGHDADAGADVTGLALYRVAF